MAATINRDSGTHASHPPENVRIVGFIASFSFLQQTSDYARDIVRFYFVLYVSDLKESPTTSFRKTTKMKS